MVINILSALAVVAFFFFYFLETLHIFPVSDKLLLALMILGVAGLFMGFANISILAEAESGTASASSSSFGT
jgi:hypothetical protein